MKSSDTLNWYPSQLPAVKRILGAAIIAVEKQGRPINARTLIEYLYVVQAKKMKLDDRIALQTAISVLTDNQNKHGHI
ncbi:hypothetical protein [Pragia fontium]|uniref:Uncharacterized protein n=2 Tax=Pragia fontium TaxID=82985 RepID=A0AAJ4W925_9GAMM|nr:hypothetical protein [Pragia fontium]AKJ41830.1 hypothetical protein QQ39_06815 [Pragia fontium]SFC36430.1 hypothetical protein SAMN02745723_102182 [Pragia fontium DSM 5563 = ATCC 49100]SUB82048.1 Uncharacterised protein [Pragia fontium]VEJ54671.1 Uncharacterised protein [Pragia fontium]GKX62153.1 hypothetical protein SOASR032_07220 [Pragia fontium]